MNVRLQIVTKLVASLVPMFGTDVTNLDASIGEKLFQFADALIEIERRTRSTLPTPTTQEASNG